MTPEQGDRIAAAAREAFEIARRTDVQFALMVGQGAVWITMRVLGVGDSDPDVVAALGALVRLRNRLAERARNGE